MKTLLYIIISVVTINSTSAQGIQDLKTKAFETKTSSKPTIQKSSKSGGLALLLSFVIPGAGHFYKGRMDVGKYFLGAEIATVLGLATVNIYGNNIKDNTKTFATEHAGINKEGKDDDYFINVGSYESVSDYNQEKLRRGEYTQLYDETLYHWDWDTRENLITYDSERKKGERLTNSTTLFVSAMIVNRIASGISALLVSPDKVRVSGEVTRDANFKPSGLKLNFSATF